MSIERALEQMERGMASPEGRAQANAETMAARAAREAEYQARVEAAKNAPKPTYPAPTKTWQQRLQDGEYGRLD